MPVSEVDIANAHVAAAGGDGKRDYVRGAFSQIAPRYDLLNHVLSLNIDRIWRRAAVEALHWEGDPTGAYVDLCAGTLDVSIALAACGGFRGRVIAADFAEPMLRAGLDKHPPPQVTPVVADAVELPLPGGLASGVIIAFGLRNLADIELGLVEAHRLLRQGGRFVVLEFTTPRSAIVRRAFHLYFHYVLPRIGALISGHRTAYEYLPRSVAEFPAPEAFAERLRAAGFTDVGWKPLTFGIAAIHTAVKE